MHDQFRGRIALNDRHLQSRTHQYWGRRSGHSPVHNFVRTQVQQGRQIQPAAARTNLGVFVNPDLIGQSLLELPVEHIERYSRRVFAVRRLNKLALSNRPQAVAVHQGPYRVPMYRLTTSAIRRCQSATAMRLGAGCKGSLQVDASRTQRW